jgi:hypothetical protein
MSYTEAPSTTMLATHCCVCGRPLRDVASVEAGIGPVCAKDQDLAALTGVDRAIANRLIHAASVALSTGDGAKVLDCADALRGIGAIKCATRIVEASVGAAVIVEAAGAMLRVTTPYMADWPESLRRHVPSGARTWDRAAKAWVIHPDARVQLWTAIRETFDGFPLVTPKKIGRVS